LLLVARPPSGKVPKQAPVGSPGGQRSSPPPEDEDEPELDPEEEPDPAAPEEEPEPEPLEEEPGGSALWPPQASRTRASRRYVLRMLLA
jgi:hypothetical protein